MPNPTTVATANHPQPTRPQRHPRIADLPIRQSEKAYLRAVIKCGSTATVAVLATEIGCTPRTVRNQRRRLESNRAICAAGFRVRAQFRGRWQTTNQVILPPVAAQRRCECLALGRKKLPPKYVRKEQDQEQKDRARANPTTTTAVRTEGDSTGRDPGPACAPETSPPTRRTPACAPETSPPTRRAPVQAKPATPPQLEYVAFLADELDVSRPDPSTLTVRSADRVIRDFKARHARSRARGLAATREQGTRLDYASTYECHACGERHYAEPGGVCGGCRQPMRLH